MHDKYIDELQDEAGSVFPVFRRRAYDTRDDPGRSDYNLAAKAAEAINVGSLDNASLINPELVPPNPSIRTILILDCGHWHYSLGEPGIIEPGNVVVCGRKAEDSFTRPAPAPYCASTAVLKVVTL